jgi:hypothetical protein
MQALFFKLHKFFEATADHQAELSFYLFQTPSSRLLFVEPPTPPVSTRTALLGLNRRPCQ